jgi:hypothetical protein
MDYTVTLCPYNDKDGQPLYCLYDPTGELVGEYSSEDDALEAMEALKNKPTM